MSVWIFRLHASKWQSGKSGNNKLLPRVCSRLGPYGPSFASSVNNWSTSDHSCTVEGIAQRVDVWNENPWKASFGKSRQAQRRLGNGGYALEPSSIVLHSALFVLLIIQWCVTSTIQPLIGRVFKGLCCQTGQRDLTEN